MINIRYGKIRDRFMKRRRNYFLYSHQTEASWSILGLKEAEAWGCPLKAISRTQECVDLYFYFTHTFTRQWLVKHGGKYILNEKLRYMGPSCVGSLLCYMRVLWFSCVCDRLDMVRLLRLKSHSIPKADCDRHCN